MAQRPSPGFMLSHPAHLLALGFGSGLSPKAPGTAASLWAWLAWLMLAHWLTPLQQGLLIVCSLLLGCWACKQTVDRLGMTDPGYVVWDEIVGMWLILWLVMPTGFTPNGDGSNDVFFIRGLDAYPTNQLVIVNRWGNRVFERVNYRNDWDGESIQGGQLPNGTYFAILEVSDGERTLQGYIDLRR